MTTPPGAPPTAPEPDTPAAVEFLQHWATEGPWVLTAISPDGPGIETDTFDAHSVKKLAGWIERWNGDRNLYFHVNPCTHPLKKKAKREDIAALAWLHVDIDPRVGEDIEEEQARALGLLTDDLPEGVPPAHRGHLLRWRIPGLREPQRTLTPGAHFSGPAIIISKDYQVWGRFHG